MSNITFTVLLKLFAVLMGCWLESAELRASLRQWHWEKVWLDEEPSHMCLRKSSMFCVDMGGSFSMLGSQSIKAKVFKVWLRFPRPFQLYYYSNNLKPISQLVKREAISLLTFALCALCIEFPCLCADGTVGSFPFSKWNSKQLNSHLCLVTLDSPPHPVLCSWDLPGPVQGDSDFCGIHIRSSMKSIDCSGLQWGKRWPLCDNCGGSRWCSFSPGET